MDLYRIEFEICLEYRKSLKQSFLCIICVIGCFGLLLISNKRLTFSSTVQNDVLFSLNDIRNENGICTYFNFNDGCTFYLFRIIKHMAWGFNKLVAIHLWFYSNTQHCIWYTTITRWVVYGIWYYFPWNLLNQIVNVTILPFWLFDFLLFCLFEVLY